MLSALPLAVAWLPRTAQELFQSLLRLIWGGCKVGPPQPCWIPWSELSVSSLPGC